MAIMKIKGVVKEYAWGNKDFLPSLLGYETSDQPQAEYWMGTHPSGEAVSEGRNLSEIIGRRLPFLFKVLAIDSPLSLQCHPNKAQAKEGWKKEEELRARGEAHNYQDDNEKAEVLCALTPVTALCGFKPFDEAVKALNEYIPMSFQKYLEEKKDIKDLFLSLFALPEEDKLSVLAELSDNIEKKGKDKKEDAYFTTDGVI
ncbi:MAG: type I phosphomannose isomerase catalytic subunit, partial [Candidatus Ornithospirochaeta sp.]